MATHRSRTWLLVLAIVLVTFVRSPDELLYPPLQVEDGTTVFGRLYSTQSAAPIWEFRGGYMHIYANLLGYIAVRLPTRSIPYVLSGIPLLVTAAVQAFFYDRRFRIYMRSDAVRFACCLAFALNPTSHFTMLTQADNMMWNLLLALVLLTMLRAPRRRPWGYLLLTNALVWSHPLTALVAPCAIAATFRARTWAGRAGHALTVVNLVVFQLVGVTREGLGRAWDYLFFALVAGGGYIERLAFHTSFGASVLETVERTEPGLIQSYFVLCLVAVCWTAGLGSVRERRTLAVAAYVTMAIVAAAYYTRSEDLIGARYAYIPGIFFMIAGAVVVGTLGRRIVKAPRARMAGAAVILAGVAALNLSAVNTRPYHAAAPDNGRLVFDFVRRLAEVERALGGPRCILMRLEKPPDWPIVIDTTAGCAKF